MKKPSEGWLALAAQSPYSQDQGGAMRHLLLSLVVLVGCGPEATFQVRESVGQLQITHATPGAELVLLDRAGQEVTAGIADEQGSLVFRSLSPGEGYVVKARADSAVTRPLTVLSAESSQPKAEDYAKQSLKAGYNYLTMRDGTTLSAWVTIPPGKGPFPTVVNYSGYDASRPKDPSPDLEAFCGDFPVLCTPPTDPSSLLAGMLGYATVSVNMRGTGCSGGAYDYFEELQLLDGYDVIEIVAAQPWVLHHQVGMVGLSYPGISQLFVAAQRPPGLAAIAPMSVIGSTDTTLLPGGILNDGFALRWVTSVLSKAVPYGQGWEQQRVDAGDSVCAENQLLHSQLVDNVAQARKLDFYEPSQHDRLSPSLFVDRIEVPVFLSSAWQDEQTGPYFFLLLDRFTHAPALRVMVSNGVHIDGFAPQVLIEWQQFLELFVAKRKPVDPTRLRNISTLLYKDFFDAPMPLPPARFASYATYDEALAAWRAELPINVRFDSGAGLPASLGAPQATFAHSFAAYPPEETVPTTLYLQKGGVLADAPPVDDAAASTFDLDPTAGARGVLAPGGNVWARLPDYAWAEPQPGKAVVFDSAPFADDTVFVGTASVDVWLESPVDDADLQVTLSELRPDGQETYVQSGWLRASHRQPGPRATALWPAQTLTREAWAPLPIGEWTLVRIGTAGFAHALRAGSRLRLGIDTPGGARADWRFALKTFDRPVTYAVAHDRTHPSRLVLPKVTGVSIPTTVPPCPSLRGQPCRGFVPAANMER